MPHTEKRSYRLALDYRASMHVAWELSGYELVDYSVVLLYEPMYEFGQVAVRVYDYAHGVHEEHPCDRQGNRLAPRLFHQGTVQEGFNEAQRLIRTGYVTMIDAWLKST